jgi:hypothetical protein
VRWHAAEWSASFATSRSTASEYTTPLGFFGSGCRERLGDSDPEVRAPILGAPEGPKGGAYGPASRDGGGGDVKYMIMMFGDQNTMMETKTPEWIRNMIGFMHDLTRELRESGELVDNQGLVDPSQATTVRFQNGIPVPTDGPFAEAKESLAGYFFVDVSEERAIEIASRIVEAIQEPIEVRQVADAPPEI